MATINTGEGYTDPQQHPLHGANKRVSQQLTALTQAAEQQGLDLSEQFEAVRQLLQSDRTEAAAKLLAELQTEIDESSG